MGYVITILLAYLIGSSNLAYFISLFLKKDIQSNGSGNLGASNATVLLGWRAGVAVGIHDIAKGFLAVFAAQLVFPELPYIGAAAGVACVLGHIFPFYLGFKGGKGFASYLGMTLALNWKLALIIMAAVVVVTVITDYIVAGTMTTIVAVPVAMGVIEHSLILALILFSATAVMIVKHKDNFIRILHHEETGLRTAIRGDKKLK